MATAYVIAGAWLEEKTVAAEMGAWNEKPIAEMYLCGCRAKHPGSLDESIGEHHVQTDIFS